MYLFKDIYQSNYQLLQKYYNNNELASFVFNQLIKEVFKKDYILIKKDHCVNDQTISLLNDYIYKITILDMPYQYILKNFFFCNIKINVIAPVLIPRNETEELTNWLILKLKNYKNNIKSIADFCSGSGCIGLALLNAFPQSRCTAFDICHHAVKTSARNAKINQLKKRYTIYQKNILYLKKNKKYDIIISNPPYISINDYDKLDASVRKWEAKKALTDNSDGNIHIIHLLNISKKKLNNNSVLIIEICHYNSDFILNEAKKTYPKALVFLWLDQNDKNRAIVVAKGNMKPLLTL